MKKQKEKQELITFTEYAQRKGLERKSVYNKITAGIIVPVVIAGSRSRFIDWTKYKDIPFRKK